ncbi:MAG: M1 family aminopeptidase [Acidobacteriota bacterium]
MRRWALGLAASLFLGAFLSLGALAEDGSDRRPFAPEGTPADYMPARAFDLLHVKAEVTLDWDQRSVAGTATNVLTPLPAGLDEITLHAAGLLVSEVRLVSERRTLAFRLDEAAQTLTADLGRRFEPGERLEVAITYRAEPLAGLYFVGPDDAFPDKPKQIWSQGESTFNRYWIPTWDHPNDKATSELVVTVPAPLTAVSNGRLVAERSDRDGWRTFHWTMEQPHATYLISVLAGELVRLEDSWQDIPLAYWVPPGREVEGRRSFSETPRMMTFFSDITGHRYPYVKYDQTCAVDFLWGGMENITATTQSLATLHDERAALDYSSRGLVAHELAHQWFGNWVTTRHWRDAWLNEGFATYFETLYRLEAEGEEGFAWRLDELAQRYFEEDDEEYRRPIVTRRYPFPMAMFDAHLYQKGARVLHMVRDLTGEAGWRAAIAEYLERHQDGSVTTADFQAAVEETTGVSLGALFETYVYGAGHPEISLSWEYVPARGEADEPGEVLVDVAQQGSRLRYPVELMAIFEDGRQESVRRQLLDREQQLLRFPAGERPATVVFDPHGTLLAEINPLQTLEEWILQLDQAPFAAQLRAARALSERRGAAVEALERLIDSRRSFRLRKVAADSLGTIGTRAAYQALDEALRAPESAVRAAAFDALGDLTVRDELADEILPQLEGALRSDPSYRVRAAAARSLGKLRAERKAAIALLRSALTQESYREVIRRAALAGLARQQDRDSWEVILTLARYGAPPASRKAALAALAELAEGREKRQQEVFALLRDVLGDRRDLRARISAAETLPKLGKPEALPLLDGITASALDPQLRRAAIASAWKLRQQTKGADDDTRSTTSRKKRRP